MSNPSNTTAENTTQQPTNPTNNAANDENGQAAGNANSGESRISASLYVGDLDSDVGESLLFDMFKQVGPVASIRVCRDTVTRRSLGYAYVNFHSITDAERALDTLNYSTIKGRPCRIMWSHRDPAIRKSGVGNVFIKNLDASIDHKALYDAFSTFGNILSCKVVTDREGESKGYGFVHYETQEAADESIEKVNGMQLNGKIVYVGHFIPKKDRQPVDPENIFTNVFVKNVDESVKDSDALREMFEVYGVITSCILMADEEGVSKGFGFVNFEDHKAASKCCDEMNNKLIGQKNLYCGRAQKKAERESELREKYKKMKEERMNKWHGVNLYVKNLDDQVKEDQLRECFEKYGSITSCKVMEDEKGHSKGFGFVCFSKPEEATKAVTEMNGFMLKNKPLYVALAQRKDVRRAQLEAQHAQRANSLRMQQANPGMGLPTPLYPAGAPVFYPQPGAPNQPGQQQRALMYPQASQMVPRRWPAQVPAGRPAYQMPNFVVPVQQRQQRGPRQQRPGQPGGVNPNNANNARRGGMKYAGGRGAAPIATDLTPQRLASASPEERRQMLGDALYPLIAQQNPEEAGKITGMILQSTADTTEVLNLIEDPNSLGERIQEALEILQGDDEESNE